MTCRCKPISTPSSARQARRPGIGSEGPGDRVRTTFYVDVPDLQAALDRAVKLGGKVASPPMTIPGTTISLAQFTDPDGNLVGLVKGMS